MVKAWMIGTLVLLGSGWAAADPGRMLAIKHWAYQLQGTPPRPSASVDCLVVDAMEDGRFLPAERVQALKKRAGGSARVVLAYLSIGEAETYRYYWKKTWKRAPPAFLAAENPEWKGNYKVRYWRPEWQAIVTEYLDRIVDAGFDGAYLDVIDAFEYFAPDGKHPSKENAAEEMTRFVKKLARHARVVHGVADFLIVPQNGATLLDEVTPRDAQEYLAAVDAIGAEDTFFLGDKAEDNRLNVQKDIVTALERFRDAGKPVLAVEYLTDPSRVRQFVKMARDHRFVPAIAVRSLDRIVELQE